VKKLAKPYFQFYLCTALGWFNNRKQYFRLLCSKYLLAGHKGGATVANDKNHHPIPPKSAPNTPIKSSNVFSVLDNLLVTNVLYNSKLQINPGFKTNQMRKTSTKSVLSMASLKHAILTLVIVFATMATGTAQNCSCPGNLLTNPSFENGVTGWSGSGGYIYNGSGYQMCGNYNGYLEFSNGTAKIWQQVTAIPGNRYTVSAYLGTHAAGQTGYANPRFFLNFYTAGGVFITSSPAPVSITANVDVAPYLPKLYSITAIAPANAAYVRVEAWTFCDYIKLDAACLTTTSPVVNLGNYVWYERINNGIQDASESGIAGVTVKLYLDANGDNVPDGAAIGTTVTNATGYYAFNNLPANKYIVGVVIPTGYTPPYTTTSSLSPNNDNNTDNNGVNLVGNELRSNFITLAPGTEPTTDGDGNNGNLTLDIGLRATGTIGDFVWNDYNKNGIQDAGEPGIAGVTVTLTYPDGYTVNTTTNASGAYQFTNLLPTATGQFYKLTFSTPANFVPTTANVGADDAKDSDVVGGVINNITLTAGQVDYTFDAGFVSNQLNIGNYVWNDVNLNGVQDAGEPAIPNATVRLYADANGDNVPDGAAIATTTTNATGNYSFTGLTPGNYIVGVVPPAGYAGSTTTSTSANPNNDNNTDNNGISLVSGELRSNFITITTAGEPTTDGDGNSGNLTLDFGLVATGSIGNYVWNDTNQNGLQDAGEPGIAGVTVTLTLPDGSTRTTTTDNTGAYLFSNLPAGTYSVSFATPTNYQPATSNAPGADDALDSDPVNGVVSGITLTPGQNNLTVDAGFTNSALRVTGNVWHDVNGMSDGYVNDTRTLPNPDASYIPSGLNAFLVDEATGLIVDVYEVDGLTGTFAFEDVAPNKDYYVVISQFYKSTGTTPPVSSLPTGWVNTGQNLGTTPGEDGLNEGILYFFVGTQDVNNVNFGIRRAGRDIATP
jgi:hypothetical protein